MERTHMREEVLDERLDKYFKGVKSALVDRTAVDYKHRSKREIAKLLGYLREAARIRYKRLESDQNKKWPLHSSEWLASHLNEVFFFATWGDTQLSCFDEIVQLEQGRSEAISDYGQRLCDIAGRLGLNECAKFLDRVFDLQGQIATATRALEALQSMNDSHGFSYPARVEELLERLDNDLATCIRRFEVLGQLPAARRSADLSGPVVLWQQRSR
ncbi:unnamed protein product [Penicillium bialowiezense]